jgi:hypothetical protein
MVFAFFDSRSLIYTHIASRSATINAPYVVDVLGKFWRSLRLKRPELLSQQWFFHWDNAPVHTAALVSDWIDAHGVQQLEHPPYSPDLELADFLLFRKVKEGLGARAWTRTPSRMPGRGSPGVSPSSTSPPPSEAGWSAEKSASV